MPGVRTAPVKKNILVAQGKEGRRVKEHNFFERPWYLGEWIKDRGQEEPERQEIGQDVLDVPQKNIQGSQAQHQSGDENKMNQKNQGQPAKVPIREDAHESQKDEENREAQEEIHQIGTDLDQGQELPRKSTLVIRLPPEVMALVPSIKEEENQIQGSNPVNMKPA